MGFRLFSLPVCSTDDLCGYRCMAIWLLSVVGDQQRNNRPGRRDLIGRLGGFVNRFGSSDGQVFWTAWSLLASTPDVALKSGLQQNTILHKDLEPKSFDYYCIDNSSQWMNIPPLYPMGIQHRHDHEPRSHP